MIFFVGLVACLRPLPATQAEAPPEGFDAQCLQHGDGPCTRTGVLPAAEGTLRVEVAGACPNVLLELRGTEPAPTEGVFARVRGTDDASPVTSLPWPAGTERARVRWGCDEEGRSDLEVDRLLSLEVGRALVGGSALSLTLPGAASPAIWVAPALFDAPPPPPGGNGVGGASGPPPGRPPLPGPPTGVRGPVGNVPEGRAP